jgi:hypothetical protein
MRSPAQVADGSAHASATVAMPASVRQACAASSMEPIRMYTAGAGSGQAGQTLNPL